MISRVKSLAEAPLREAYGMRNKQERSQKLKTIYAEIETKIAEESAAAGKSVDGNLVSETLFSIEANVVRSQILNGEPRIDGRDTRTVRPISIRTGVLREPMAQRFLRVVKRRPWLWPRWAPRVMSKLSMLWPVSTVIASCFTTTCRRLPPVRRAVSDPLSVARSATAGWLSGP